MLNGLSQQFRQQPLWGLRRAPRDATQARRVERRWRWPVLLLLAGTVPAFYAELLQPSAPALARLAYLLAGLAAGAALVHTAWHTGRLAEHLLANPLNLVLVPGLMAAAALPGSSSSSAALACRLVVALLTLVHMVWTLRHLITRGGLSYLLGSAALVLGLCGVGFWWLEPRALTLGDGLWLAFTTAATVGFGDIVPTTAASKIFSVFVVMLGYGVLSLVTAAIAARWVETEERTIEHEILRDLHRQMDLLHQEIAGLRNMLGQGQHQGELQPEAPASAVVPASLPAGKPVDSAA